MDSLIDRILNAIPDYRLHEGFGLTEESVTNWIKQFPKSDRDFILNELCNIFEKRYISEATAKASINDIIDTLKKDFGYSSAEKLLLNSYFFDLQEEGKSQKVLLKFFNRFITDTYDLKLKDCGTESKKNLIYLDDILCTGNTIHRDLINWLNIKDGNGTSNFDKVKKKDSRIITICFVEHQYNSKLLRQKLWHFNSHIPSILRQYYFEEYYVENDFTIEGSSLNLAFPLKKHLSPKAKKYGNKVHEEVNKYHIEKKYAIHSHFCRDEDTPKKEILFSSKSNRIRFENILLDTGINILENVQNLKKKNMRPLGFDLPSHKTFGFGTLSFTWRNITNNSPLVFWYKNRNWMPLFEKKGK